MKLFKLILLCLFLFSNAYANTIYELIKIPHLEIGQQLIVHSS